jgi:hypothetical protein
MNWADTLARSELVFVVAAVLTRVSMDSCYRSPAAVGLAELFDPAATAANYSEHHGCSAVAAAADIVEAVEVRAVDVDVVVVVVVVEVVCICLAALEDSACSVRTASVVLEGVLAHETRDLEREKL